MGLVLPLSVSFLYATLFGPFNEHVHYSLSPTSTAQKRDFVLHCGSWPFCRGYRDEMAVEFSCGFIQQVRLFSIIGLDGGTDKSSVHRRGRGCSMCHIYIYVCVEVKKKSQAITDFEAYGRSESSWVGIS